MGHHIFCDTEFINHIALLTHLVNSQVNASNQFQKIAGKFQIAIQKFVIKLLKITIELSLKTHKLLVIIHKIFQKVSHKTTNQVITTPTQSFTNNHKIFIQAINTDIKRLIAVNDLFNTGKNSNHILVHIFVKLSLVVDNCQFKVWLCFSILHNIFYCNNSMHKTILCGIFNGPIKIYSIH